MPLNKIIYPRFVVLLVMLDSNTSAAVLVDIDDYDDDITILFVFQLSSWGEKIQKDDDGEKKNEKMMMGRKNMKR